MRAVVVGVASLALLSSCSAGSAQPATPDGTYYCGSYVPLDELGQPDEDPSISPDDCVRAPD